MENSVMRNVYIIPNPNAVKRASFEFETIYPTEMITIRFAGWICGRIVSLQPDTDIQNLL